MDRSEGSERIVGLITTAGGNAEYIASRDDCAAHIVSIARPSDRVVIMGARDDTLTTMARAILRNLD